jgi:hypothetical protein
MSSDDPHGEIYKMLTGNSPEAQYIQAMYNDTSAEYGLHPDDDFEDIIDRMVDEMEGHMSFEGHSPHKKGTKKYKAHMAAMHAGMNEGARGLGSIDWPDVDEDGDSAMAQHAENAIRHGMHAYDAYGHVYSMTRHRDWMEDNKKMIIDMFASYGLATESVNEGEEKPYICVHAKKGKHECRAETSYEAAKKAAKAWGLKSTSGIDAYLAIDEGALDDEIAAYYRQLRLPNMKSWKKLTRQESVNEDDADSAYGWDDAAIAAGVLGTAYAAGKAANRPPKPLTPYQQLKKDQKAARQAQKQLDKQNRKLAKNNMKVAQSNDKIAQFRKKYANPDIKAVPDTKIQKATKFGKKAGKFALKKLAWPIALGYAANSAYKGYHSDPNANLATKVKNAGARAVDDYTGGAVGWAYNKMFGEAAESLQEHGFTVQDLQEKVDQFILVKENVDTLRKIVADKSVMPVKFEDGTMKVDMTTASIFLQAFDKMREDNQAKVAEMMRTKKGF